MSHTIIRKPVGNFFIKRSLQMRLITKIVIAVVVSTLVCVGTLLLTYFVKYQDIAFYQVILDHNMDIPPRFDIFSIIVPSLVVASLVNVVVAVGIGLYASRKYAVPIYKLEQWADLLKQGKMTATLQFREKEEFRELSSHCNQLSSSMRERFLGIKKSVQQLRKRVGESEELKAVEDHLETMQLEIGPIEVHTTFHRISENNEGT